MFSNNNHNSSCAFGEQIVSYIYNEASAKERNEFESHLPNCLSCADEIAGFGLVRSSISEWRREELFVLESPALKIPALRPIVATSEKGTWIDELRKLFSFSPAWAAGFAVLIICVGLVWLFFGNSKNEMIVEIPPIVEEKPIEQPKEENAFVKPQDEKPVEIPQKVKQTEQKTVAPKNRETIKAVNTPKLKSVQPKFNNSMATNKQNLNRNNKSNTVQKQEAPTLSGVSDEDDKSLRLAELFNEIDGK